MNIRLYWYKWWGGVAVIGNYDNGELLSPRLFHITKNQFVLGLLPGEPESIKTVTAEYMYPATKEVLELYNESISKIITPSVQLVN